MEAQPDPIPGAAALRRQAEARLRERPAKTGGLGSEADTQRLVHELEVHQIELEMQNEELRIARAEVESGLEKYSDLYHFAPVGYLSLDREGTILEANFAFASLLGTERSRLLDRRLGLFVAAADRPALNEFLAQVFASKARVSRELVLLREGKTPVEARIEAVVASSGEGCRATVTDITERKRAENDRLTLSKLESTGILAGGIAHDFNNLLTVILLDLELARALVSPGGELAQLLDDAKRAAMTSHGLTQQLTRFARGGTPLRVPTRLNGLIQDSVRPALSGSRVRCEYLLADDLWLVELDAGQIGQVFQNLVLNAREAMPDGGVITVRAENVSVGSGSGSSLPPGDYVRVSIADQGPGIARPVLPRIFDPYFSTKERGNQKGMGLGLTICHTVMQRHEGAIAVDSELGVGTVFLLHFPASRKLLPPVGEPAPASLPRPGKILVMDDEEGVRSLLGRLLQSMGHEVELVEDGRRAIEAYGRAKKQGCPFDAVILDLSVGGGIGGQEAIQPLREIDPAVKAIVISGYASDPVLLEPERYGFKGSLAKPFGSARLRNVLAQVLG